MSLPLCQLVPIDVLELIIGSWLTVSTLNVGERIDFVIKYKGTFGDALFRYFPTKLNSRLLNQMLNRKCFLKEPQESLTISTGSVQVYQVKLMIWRKIIYPECSNCAQQFEHFDEKIIILRRDLHYEYDFMDYTSRAQYMGVDESVQFHLDRQCPYGNCPYNSSAMYYYIKENDEEDYEEENMEDFDIVSNYLLPHRVGEVQTRW